MTISPLAGKPAPREMLVDPARLEREYFERRPDLDDPEQRVSFGTSGHRGSSLRGSFTEAHILAITQAICDFRRTAGHRWPALHGAGHARAFRARPAHGARGPRRQSTCTPSSSENDGVTPTPVISRAILVHNRGRSEHLADGIVITPSHNPPEDGGFKYNPTHGGPADTDVTRWIENRANDTAAQRQRRCETGGLRRSPQRRHDAPGRLRPALRQRSAQRCRLWRRFAPPASSSPSTRSAAPPCTTGSRSTRSTSWISPW